MISLFKNKHFKQKVLQSLEPVEIIPPATDSSYNFETAINPASFGKDFNLIRAVSEYGNERIKMIDKELQKMIERTKVLTEERATLQKLVDVVK